MARRDWTAVNPETIIEDLLRHESGERRRTDSHTLASIEKMKASHRRRIRERTAAAFARRPQPDKRTIVDRYLAQMDPSEWYGLGDVARAAGLDWAVIDLVGRKMMEKRLAERARNPAWIPHDGARGRTKGRIPPGLRLEPKWLYRLTIEGEARRLCL